MSYLTSFHFPHDNKWQHWRGGDHFWSFMSHLSLILWLHEDSNTKWCCLLSLLPFTTPPHFAAAAKSHQSCPTLCNPIDGSPPGSPIPGIFQARTLEWVAISFSNVWKWKLKVTSLSSVRLLATPWTAAHQAPPSMGFSRQEYWSGVPFPLNGQGEWIGKSLKKYIWSEIYGDFPGGPGVKTSFSVGSTSSIPGWGVKASRGS